MVQPFIHCVQLYTGKLLYIQETPKLDENRERGRKGERERGEKGGERGEKERGRERREREGEKGGRERRGERLS